MDTNTWERTGGLVFKGERAQRKKKKSSLVSISADKKKIIIFAFTELGLINKFV